MMLKCVIGLYLNRLHIVTNVPRFLLKPKERKWKENLLWLDRNLSEITSACLWCTEMRRKQVLCCNSTCLLLISVHLKCDKMNAMKYGIWCFVLHLIVAFDFYCSGFVWKFNMPEHMRALYVKFHDVAGRYIVEVRAKGPTS